LRGEELLTDSESCGHPPGGDRFARSSAPGT
jgi:hypothetical protein